MKKNIELIILLLMNVIYALPYDYDFNSNGRRVVLVDASVTEEPPTVTLNLLDSEFNSSEPYIIYRRNLYENGNDWIFVGNADYSDVSWTDYDVEIGDVWEYQIKRQTSNGFAFGYICVGIKYDQTDYKGRMILLIDESITVQLQTEIIQLKTDLTCSGWFVEEITANRVDGWDMGETVTIVKQQIIDIYNSSPTNDKPSHLFILGHIPVPRSGLDGQPADGHIESRGARGADCYYADINGVFTDIETFIPGNLNDPNAENIPGDYKWDQDFIPTELEMAFGRVDFADLGSFNNTSEIELYQNYLSRLHQFKSNNWNLGNNTAFGIGYANSQDGSYRSLPPISGSSNVVNSNLSGNSNHPEWVQNNGPFLMYMQNQGIPNLDDWFDYGMDALIFSSDQSAWGWWALEESPLGTSGKIRSLLATNSKCLVNLWTTTAINIFHQPGIGETFGNSCKRIIEHNPENNIYEKQEQAWDNSGWWSRTHMNYHGDPTITLFPVSPISNLAYSQTEISTLLYWINSPDENIIGYHIYHSEIEFGIYERQTEIPIIDNQFNIGNLDGWFMVRAIKLQTTGSGTFLNPSLGKILYIESNLLLGDVNYDGVIDILDISQIINYILGFENNIENADINGDGLINIIDIILVINLITE